MSAGFQDPFYLVREEIQGSVNGIKEKFGKWERLPPTSAERAVLSHDVEQAAESVAWQLDQLDSSITTAERNPARFNLDPKELTSRRQWTTATRAVVDKARSVLAAAKPAAKPKANGASGAAATAADKLNAAAVADNDRFIGQAGEQQQLLLQKQDADLDVLAVGLKRIGDIGLEIHGELDSQAKIIEELDNDVSTTSGRLQASLRKVNALIKKSGIGGQLALIVGLVVVLIVLVVVAVYF